MTKPFSFRTLSFLALFLTLPTLTWQHIQSKSAPETAHLTMLTLAAFAQTKPIPQTASSAQPLVLYQPLQHLPWEGQKVSPTGIAHFPLEASSNESIVESDLAVARVSGDPYKLAKVLAVLGLSHHLQGEYDQAIAYYKQGLEVTKQTTAPEIAEMLLGNIGLAYVQKGDYYAEAIDYLEEYWQLTYRYYHTSKVAHHKEAQALGNLGNAYFGADLYVKAIAFHQKRLTLARQFKHTGDEAKALSDLGIVDQALGNFSKAIDHQQQALTLARQIKDRSIESAILGNLGVLYQTQSNYAKASEYQQQRLTLVRQLKDLRGEAEALANLGGVAYFQGDYSQAIALYNQSWKIAWETLHDPDILFRIRGNQGLVYAQMGNFDQALAFYKEHLRYADSRGSRREAGVARINTAAAYWQKGDLPTATKMLRQAIDSWEALRARLGSNDGFKISIFETQNAPYGNLQSVLVAQNQPEAALEISERGRARAFAELLARRLTTFHPREKPLPLTSPTVEQIKQIARNHQATLVEYSIISSQFVVEGKLETHESELLIWVVQPTGTITLRRVDLKSFWQCQNRQSCSAKALTDLVSTTRQALNERSSGIGKGNRESTVNPLQQLHRLLIQPIADLLPTDPAAPVVFIPQRSLLLVPFAALQDAKGNFLIEQHTIAIAPSIQILDLTAQLRQRAGTKVKQADRQTPPSLIIGNPTMPKIVTMAGEPPEQLPPLPGSEAEAKQIAQLLNTKALIGPAAEKARVVRQMSQSRFIHLATHGLMSDFPGLGIPGAIALAPDPTGVGTLPVEENGILTANEIFDLKLNAELVVLSACNTGQGRITGDGVVGLSRALIAARVPSVIVSLWAVPDTPTALLMTEFYRSLQQQPNKAQALRQAMLTTLKQHPYPLDWAAFMLIGES